MRHILALLWTLTAVLPSLHAQTILGCDPDVLLAVDDTYVIQESDLPTFGESLLDNDIINVDQFSVSVEGLPPCFAHEEGSGFIFYTGGSADGSSCCGTFTFTYSLQSPNSGCIAGVTIIVECEEPKGDCSTIFLESSINSDQILDDGTVVDTTGTDCVYVCENSITTIIAPHSDQNTYDWTVTGGSLNSATQGESTAEVEWGAAGQGNVSVIITGPGGTEVMQQCVEIGAAPVADFTAPTPVCLLTPVQFTSNSTPGADHFWDFGNGASSNQVNPSHTFTTPGIHEVVLTVTSPLLNAEGDTVCCCQDTYALDIEVLSEKGPDIECITTLCEGDSACYWTNTTCPGATYDWTVTDANGNAVTFSGQNTPEICLQWDQGPFGEVSLAVSGCGGICDQPSTVQVPIISSTATISGPDIVCPGDVVVYSVPKWMDVVYDWTVTGGTVASTDGNQVSVIWGPAGVGTLHVSYESPFLLGLKAHDAPDCSGEGNLTVDILPELSFTSAPNTACTGETLTFATNATVSIDWQVSAPGIGSTSGAFYTVTFPSAGAYTVTASDPGSNYCNPDISMTVVVVDPPNPVISGPTEGCTGEDLLYFVDPVEPGISYSWSVSPSNGTLCPNPACIFGTNTTVNWLSTGSNHELFLSAYRSTAPVCEANTSIEFNPLSPVTPLGLDQDTACANQIESYVLSTSGTANGEEFTWSISPTTAGSVVDGQGTEQVQIQWNDHTGNATVTVVSSLCNQQETATFAVIVSPQPNPVISQTGDLCPGAFNPAELTTSTPGLDHAWDDPNGLQGFNPEFIVQNAGEHEVTVTDGQGCYGTAYFTVEAAPVPVADITSPDPDVICIPTFIDDVIMYTPTASGWSHLWNTGSTASSQSHMIQNVLGSTTYTVTTTIDATGCSAFDLYTVTESACECTGNCDCEPADQLDPTAVVDCNSVTVDSGSTLATATQWNYSDGDGWTSSNSNIYSEAGCYTIQAVALVPDLNQAGAFCEVTGFVGVCIPLAADIGCDITGCSDVAFADLSSYIDQTGAGNNIVAWSWDFGDGNSVNYSLPSAPPPSQVNHLYAGGGNYQVTLTVTAANGCTATATKTVTIGSVGMPNLTIDSLLCVGEPGIHSAFATNAVNYTWSFPDGVTFQGPVIEHTFTSVPTGNTITVTAEDSQGCTQTATAVVTVHPEPDDPFAATLDEIVCFDPGKALLQAMPGFDTYQWLDENEVDISGATSDSYLAGAGEYFVTIEDANGCFRTSGPVSVQVLPDLSPAILGPSTVCGTDDAFFQTVGSFSSHKWFVDGNLYSTAPTLNFSGVVGTSYDVHLVVTDATNNCPHSSDTVAVEWVEDLLFQLTSPVILPCAGDDILINVDPADPSVNYTWNTGATGSSIIAQNAGTYIATGVNANGCAHSADFVILPAPDLCEVPSGCHEDCYAQLVCAPEGHQAYQWYQDGNAIAGATDPCHLVNATGLFWVEVTGLNGCTSTSDILDFTLLDCSCDFEPLIEVTSEDDSCCVILSFDNNSTGCFYELDVHTHGEPASFYPSSDFTYVSGGQADLQLEYAGGVAPIGIIQDAVRICFTGSEGTYAGVHTVGWEWSNPDEDAGCAGEFPFQCESDTTECPPFQCENHLYQVFGDSIGFFSPDNISGGFSSAAHSHFNPINATGYNTLDNYAYGLTQDANDRVILIRIGDNGCTEPLNVITLDPSHPDFNQIPDDLNSDNEFTSVPNQGDFEEGTHLLYVRMPNQPRIHAIDVTSGTVVTTYDLTSGDATASSVADFAFSVPDQVFYGVSHMSGIGGVSSNRLVRFDPWNGDASYVSPASPSPTESTLSCSGWGAAYSDVTGQIYATCNSVNALATFNTYNFNTLDGSATGAFQTGSGVLINNDGFSCPNAVIEEPDDSTCVSILEDFILCEDDGNLTYGFTLCNGASTPFAIGHFTLSAILPGGVQVNPGTFDLSGAPIAPGDCGDFSVTLTGVGSNPEVCFMISTHEADPTTHPDAACCFLEHCVEVPPCDSDCATLSLFDGSYCDEDGYHLEFGVSNNTGYTFGQLQMSYQGQSGTIVQWVTGMSILPMTSDILNVTLDPNLLGESPFCIDLVFYEEGASGELVECCHLPWCFDLPPCDEDILGCTDPTALNYNPNATVDDGSCEYNEICYGPADPNYPCTEEYDPVCGCDGNTYANACYAFYIHGIQSWTDGPCGTGGPVLGCTVDEACNFNPDATEDDGSCAYPLDGFDCDGNCLNDVNGNGICDEFEVGIDVEGCTNPDAVNFNPEATVDDGSCLWDTCVLPTLINPYYPCTEEYDPVCGCDGMTYANACYAVYFGGLVSWTQGACDGSGNPGNPNACPTDINEDGTTNVADLLMVLGEFASDCN